MCLDWLWTLILLISASWIARITGMTHWHPSLKMIILFAQGFAIWAELRGDCWICDHNKRLDFEVVKHLDSKLGFPWSWDSSSALFPMGLHM
jgi:hypothetical protein